jgi:hypothetical protein
VAVMAMALALVKLLFIDRSVAGLPSMEQHTRNVTRVQNKGNEGISCGSHDL